MTTKSIKLQNENCTFTFNLDTKSIYVFGKYGNYYFKSHNETTRGIKKACKELKKIFNENTSIYSIVDFFSSSKIYMTFTLA